MKIEILVLNDQGEPHFKCNTALNFDALILAAKERESFVLEKGADFAAGILPVFAQDILDAVDHGDDKDLDRGVMNLALSAWVFDSLFCKITPIVYLENVHHFMIRQDGAVQHTRVPIKAPSTL